MAKSSRILEKNLTYLPFWVVSLKASSTYKGVLERLTQAWLVKCKSKGKTYQLIVDGTTVAKGDIPPADFRIL